jgi:hypothetical protein
LRGEQSQKCGFYDIKYERQLEIYGECPDDIEVCRSVARAAEGKLLLDALGHWSAVDRAVITLLVEKVNGIYIESVGPGD